MTHIGTREEWLAARRDLLAREKELTRRSDELARERQALPWVPVEAEYVFGSARGPRTLRDLFGDRSQLLVYHLMMGPDWDEACLGCTYTADSFERAVAHLPHRDVAFVAVSRTTVARLEAYKARMDWSFDWVSCLGTTFNTDFGDYGDGFNFGTTPEIEIDELHGLSAFALEDGTVYHTYSTFDRGTDGLSTTWQLLDRAPKGRTGDFRGWPRRRYDYAAA